MIKTDLEILNALPRTSIRHDELREHIDSSILRLISSEKTGPSEFDYKEFLSGLFFLAVAVALLLKADRSNWGPGWVIGGAFAAYVGARDVIASLPGQVGARMRAASKSQDGNSDINSK